MIRVAFIVLLVLLAIHFGGSTRSIKVNPSLVSDGINQTGQSSAVIELDLAATTVTCEVIYGFFPCTTTLLGQLFLLIVYEYLLSLSQIYISSGSDLFFEMFGTGLFGASLFHMLGMIPQVALLLVTEVSGTTETIKSMAAMKMGLLAGSVIMTLTLCWGSVVAFGSYDLDLSDTSASSNSENDHLLETSASSHNGNKKSFSLTGYGVTTDEETRYSARIMLLTMIPFFILQLAKIFNSSSGMRLAVLISLIITLPSLIAYCTYQVFEPWIQNRRLEYLMGKYVRKNLLQNLLTTNGKPDVHKIKKLFQRIDKDRNSYISTEELESLIIGIQIEKIGMNEHDFVAKVKEEFDISNDSQISETEFVKGLSNWLNKANNSNQFRHQHKFFWHSNSNGSSTTEEKQSQIAPKRQGKGAANKDKPWWNYIKAAFLIVLGTAMTFFLATPLMKTLHDFSTAANIPSFLVSYIVVPLALNFRQGFRAISSARKKTNDAASLTFSEIYSGVFMNNMMGLATFLALVYLRDIPWDFSAEILVVLIICTSIGFFASFSTNIPFWACIVAYLMYPISLLLLYILTSVLGWS